MNALTNLQNLKVLASSGSWGSWLGINFIIFGSLDKIVMIFKPIHRCVIFCVLRGHWSIWLAKIANADRRPHDFHILPSIDAVTVVVSVAATLDGKNRERCFRVRVRNASERHVLSFVNGRSETQRKTEVKFPCEAGKRSGNASLPWDFLGFTS